MSIIITIGKSVFFFLTKYDYKHINLKEIIQS